MGDQGVQAAHTKLGVPLEDWKQWRTQINNALVKKMVTGDPGHSFVPFEEYLDYPTDQGEMIFGEEESESVRDYKKTASGPYNLLVYSNAPENHTALAGKDFLNYGIHSRERILEQELSTEKTFELFEDDTVEYDAAKNGRARAYSAGVYSEGETSKGSDRLEDAFDGVEREDSISKRSEHYTGHIPSSGERNREQNTVTNSHGRTQHNTTSSAQRSGQGPVTSAQGRPGYKLAEKSRDSVQMRRPHHQVSSGLVWDGPTRMVSGSNQCVFTAGQKRSSNVTYRGRAGVISVEVDGGTGDAGGGALIYTDQRRSVPMYAWMHGQGERRQSRGLSPQRMKRHSPGTMKQESRSPPQRHRYLQANPQVGSIPQSPPVRRHLQAEVRMAARPMAARPPTRPVYPQQIRVSQQAAQQHRDKSPVKPEMTQQRHGYFPGPGYYRGQMQQAANIQHVAMHQANVPMQPVHVAAHHAQPVPKVARPPANRNFYYAPYM